MPDLHSSSSPSESHLYNLHQNSYNKITLAIRAGYRRNGGNYVRAVEKDVYEANMELQEKGMVIYTWGNASGIDREHNYVVIKPSGVEYDLLKPEDMVVVDFDGNVVEGKYRPSSDTPTHIELYKSISGSGRWYIHILPGCYICTGRYGNSCYGYNTR